MISLRELRTLSYPNKRNQLSNNNINKRSTNTNYPHVVVNKKVSEDVNDIVSCKFNSTKRLSIL